MGHDFIDGRTGVGVVRNLGIHDAFKFLEGTRNPRNTILLLQRLPKSSRVLFTIELVANSVTNSNIDHSDFTLMSRDS